MRQKRLIVFTVSGGQVVSNWMPISDMVLELALGSHSLETVYECYENHKPVESVIPVEDLLAKNALPVIKIPIDCQDDDIDSLYVYRNRIESWKWQYRDGETEDNNE